MVDMIISFHFVFLTCLHLHLVKSYASAGVRLHEPDFTFVLSGDLVVGVLLVANTGVDCVGPAPHP